MFIPAIDLGSSPLTPEGVALAEARAYRRVMAQAEACELQALRRYLGADTTIDDARVLEVAAVFTVSERTARDRLELAVALTTRLPATWTELRAGRIDGHKARAITEATYVLTAEQAAQVEAAVLPARGDRRQGGRPEENRTALPDRAEQRADRRYGADPAVP